MKRFWIGILLLSFSTFSDASLKEGASQGMDAEILYQSHVADQFYPLILSIAAEGIATLKVGTNRDNPASNAVGVFRHKLEAAKVSELTRAFRSPDFLGMETAPFFPEGGPVRLLSIREKGAKEITKWVTDHTPNPPAFLKVEAEAMAFVNLVRQYPVHAISMKLSPVPNQIERGKPLEFSMTVIGSGFETVQFLHPDNWSARGVQLQLIGLRNDIPLEKLEEYHQRFENVTRKNLLKAQGTKVTKPLTALSTNSEVVFTFRISLDWPPGQYESQLSLVTPLLDQKGVEQMNCELMSKTFLIKVLGKSKPGDEPEESDEEEPEEEGS
jgi:hypothetical protein